MGYRLRNPDLARTYRLLARYGPSYLYGGPFGRAIVQADDHPAVTPGNKLVTLPGIMTTSDLRATRPASGWRLIATSLAAIGP
jgi:gamma-glutamyltranspeptidase / glutathione hydrolase